jgi:hypothetical protein
MTRELLPGQKPTAVPYYEFFSDATNTYTIRVIDPARLTASKVRNYNRWVSNQVMVASGSIPFCSDAMVSPVWLAYASGCAFRDAASGRIKKFLTLSEYDFNIRSNDVPFFATYASKATTDFPVSIVFSNEGSTLIPDGNGGAVKKVLNPPYDQGFINAVYEVAESETIQNQPIPKRFRITFYGGKAGAKSGSDTVVSVRYEGEAVSVRELTDPVETEPVVPGKSWVYDGRLSAPGGGPLWYYSTNPIYNTNDTNIGKIRRNLEEQYRLSNP